MNEIIYLERTNEDGSVYINSFGLTNQLFFENIGDALYHLYLHYKYIEMKKIDDNFLKIVTKCGDNDEKSYFNITRTKALSYGRD
jgi:hypothetical protein